MVTFKMNASKAMAELMLSNCFEERPILDRRINLDLSQGSAVDSLALRESRNQQVQRSC